jgi:hypothetical protein
MYKAQLVGVYLVKEMPDELRPFLNLQAARERREPKPSDKVAVLQVVGTSSYIALFLDSIGSVSALEGTLRQQQVEMNEVTKMTMERLLTGKQVA